MNLLWLFLIVVLIGVALYYVNRYVPMQEGVRTVLNIAVVIGLIIFLVYIFASYVPDVRVGR